MESLIWIIICLILFTFPIYILFKVIKSFYRGNDIKLIKALNFFNPVEFIYISIIIAMCGFGLFLTFYAENAGKPLLKYKNGYGYENGYASLSRNHLLTIIIFFILGVLAYLLIRFLCEKLSPIIYSVSSSLLILNVVFTIFYYYHTNVDLNKATGNAGDTIYLIRIGFLLLSILYICELKISLDKFICKEKRLNKNYKSDLLNKLYSLAIKYQTMPFIWILSLFPVLLIVQLILVMFGQQPDSFIKAFLDTSSFNYSQVPTPPPILIEHNGHYLCTVSVKGHKKLVKPIRAGIRREDRILVNRQLLVANAFENILEEYTPKFHKFIRYIYDKYGYPLSKHINNSWSADFIYILMKPLEWIFIIVLYTVDINPENRINIQYTELRK